MQEYNDLSKKSDFYSVNYASDWVDCTEEK